MPPTEHSEQSDQSPTPQHTFSTREGRKALFKQWVDLRIADGTIEEEKPAQQYTQEKRAAFLADWLRWCITQKALDPRKRLPPYHRIASYFYLEKKWVARVIQQLRDEGLLPERKTRKDKDQPQWTKRDGYFLEYVGQMRALHFNQARRLLARESEYEVENGMLSISRTSEIIGRYTAKNVRFAVSKKILRSEPKVIYLTRRGLQHVGLDFRAEAPSVRVLSHLFRIVEVRMKLEEEYPRMKWISERAIQAEMERRQKGDRLKHIPDGILVLPKADGTKECIDIEVQISKPSLEAVKDVIDPHWSGSTNALRYYVTKASRGVVKAAYQEMEKKQKVGVKYMRPSMEIIDLEEWLHPSTTPK
jgi:DNA-binding transcriptional regulator YhcF (GntR family)